MSSEFFGSVHSGTKFELRETAVHYEDDQAEIGRTQQIQG